MCHPLFKLKMALYRTFFEVFFFLYPIGKLCFCGRDLHVIKMPSRGGGRQIQSLERNNFAFSKVFQLLWAQGLVLKLFRGLVPPPRTPLVGRGVTSSPYVIWRGCNIMPHLESIQSSNLNHYPFVLLLGEAKVLDFTEYFPRQQYLNFPFWQSWLWAVVKISTQILLNVLKDKRKVFLMTCW